MDTPKDEDTFYDNVSDDTIINYEDLIKVLNLIVLNKFLFIFYLINTCNIM